MKSNIDTVLLGSRVILVPYRPEHVPKYHEWMLDEELRAQTASEPLTLEEEYEMQAKWQLDDDKLTFIVLSRSSENGTPLELADPQEKLAPTDARLASLPMVGDVNIFLHGIPPYLRQNMSSLAKEEDEDDEFYAEAEIMIAEPSFRRKGLAIEALQLMLAYATGQPEAFLTSHSTTKVPSSPLKIPAEGLMARISDTNVPSIRLFEKLGFRITKRVEVFREVEMRFRR